MKNILISATLALLSRKLHRATGPQRYGDASRKVNPMATSASWRKDKGSSSERGYTWAWTKARRVYLTEHPLCVMCTAAKRVTVAEVVDHIIPHQGNQELFWDEANWQPLCKRHHDTDKAEQEGRHKAKAKFGEDGRVVW